MENRLGLGVVGTGMGRAHMNSYKSHFRADLVAICDVDEERLAATSAGVGVTDTYTDRIQLFKRADLDGVSIAVPNKFHVPLTIAALDAGLYVLCEKPMATTLRRAQRMQAAAERASRNLMINFSFRFTEGSYALKQQVEAGVVGNIYCGRSVWHRQRGIPASGS